MSDSWGKPVTLRSELFQEPPSVTEENIPDLSNKVVLVTGGGSGIGLAFSKLVYAKNAIVWISARNETKAKAAVEEIRSAVPNSAGELHYVLLDFADLPTIKPGLDKFITSTSRLDLLMNNAGVMSPPDKSKTKQGFELQLGTNVIGHHALTVLLTPLIVQTAKTSPPGSVRVIWTSSIGGVKLSPAKGGILWDDISYERTESGARNFGAYGQSKAGNIYQAAEFARRYGSEGVVTASLHPGLISTNLSRSQKWDPLFLLLRRLAKPAIWGAYTLAFAAFSPEVVSRNGKFITPYGRFMAPREDMIREVEAGEGGNGYKLFKWCDEQVAPYM